MPKTLQVRWHQGTAKPAWPGKQQDLGGFQNLVGLGTWSKKTDPRVGTKPTRCQRPCRLDNNRTQQKTHKVRKAARPARFPKPFRSKKMKQKRWQKAWAKLTRSQRPCRLGDKRTQQKTHKVRKAARPARFPKPCRFRNMKQKNLTQGLEQNLQGAKDLAG